MKVGDLLKLAKEELKNVESGRLIAEELMAFVSSKDKNYFFIYPEFDVSEKQVEQFWELLLRAKEGEPLAYLVGEKDFMGRQFEVGAGVLIPRPETEELVGMVFERMRKLRLKMGKGINGPERQRRTWSRREVIKSVEGGGIVRRNGGGKISMCSLVEERGGKKFEEDWGIEGEEIIRFVELGAGSGCLGISLVLEGKKFEVGVKCFGVLIEKSLKAISFLKKNVDKFCVSELVDIVEGDFLNVEKLSGDVLVANLPYIGFTEFNEIQYEVKKFEPSEALFSGEDGLDLYREMLNKIRDGSFVFNLIGFEFGMGQEKKIVDELVGLDKFYEIEFVKDLFGVLRFCFLSRKVVI